MRKENSARLHAHGKAYLVLEVGEKITFQQCYSDFMALTYWNDKATSCRQCKQVIVRDCQHVVN